MGPATLLLWPGDNQPQHGRVYTSDACLRDIWLGNYGSAESFELRQHAAVLLQFNTRELQQQPNKVYLPTDLHGLGSPQSCGPWLKVRPM